MIYEAHITIEPVEGDKFDLFESLCSAYKFKPAHLVMMKLRQVTDTRSNRDSFCTGHSSDFEDLKFRTEQLVELLKRVGLKVWRYKVEQTLLDIRFPQLISESQILNNSGGETLDNESVSRYL